MKRRVHAEILRDMQRYIPDFDENPYYKENYEVTYGETDPNVITSLRDFYDSHLPVDVTAWVRVNEPDKNLIYGKGLGKQLCFIRDVICDLLSSSYEEYQKNMPMVISTHYSKSVKLPVYCIKLKKYNIEIILRYNFYNWIISINSKKPLDFDYMNLFDPDDVINAVYCEGFPKSKVYGSYNQDHCKFTIELSNNYEVYVLFYLLKNYLGIKKNK